MVTKGPLVVTWSTKEEAAVGRGVHWAAIQTRHTNRSNMSVFSTHVVGASVWNMSFCLLLHGWKREGRMRLGAQLGIANCAFK